MIFLSLLKSRAKFSRKCKAFTKFPKIIMSFKSTKMLFIFLFFVICFSWNFEIFIWKLIISFFWSIFKVRFLRNFLVFGSIAYTLKMKKWEKFKMKSTSIWKSLVLIFLHSLMLANCWEWLHHWKIFHLQLSLKNWGGKKIILIFII